MNLLLVGISHRTAPVDLRERVDFQVRGVSDALRSVAGRGSRHAGSPGGVTRSDQPRRAAQVRRNSAYGRTW